MMKIKNLFVNNIISKTVLKKKSPGSKDMKAEIREFIENERIAYATLNDSKSAGFKTSPLRT